MDFNTSDELKSVQQLAQQIIGDFTEVDKLKAIETTEERFDCDLWMALAEAGLLGLDVDGDRCVRCRCTYGRIVFPDLFNRFGDARFGVRDQ